jgi:hypothetical protein
VKSPAHVPKTTEISSTLTISPILNDQGRWQISWLAQFKRELLNNFYLNIQINEYFDSRSPGEANTNDLSLVTSLGLTL